MRITYYFRYSEHVASRCNLPLAEIIHFHSESYNISRKMGIANKVWRQKDGGPIIVAKSREGLYDFDQDEFIRMLFVAEGGENG